MCVARRCRVVAPSDRPLPASLLLPPLQLVFALVSVGAIVLTVNVVLLGGTIGFFQVGAARRRSAAQRAAPLWEHVRQATSKMRNPSSLPWLPLCCCGRCTAWDADALACSAPTHACLCSTPLRAPAEPLPAGLLPVPHGCGGHRVRDGEADAGQVRGKGCSRAGLHVRPGATLAVQRQDGQRLPCRSAATRTPLWHGGIAEPAGRAHVNAAGLRNPQLIDMCRTASLAACPAGGSWSPSWWSGPPGQAYPSSAAPCPPTAEPWPSTRSACCTPPSAGWPSSRDP